GRNNLRNSCGPEEAKFSVGSCEQRIEQSAWRGGRRVARGTQQRSRNHVIPGIHDVATKAGEPCSQELNTRNSRPLNSPKTRTGRPLDSASNCHFSRSPCCNRNSVPVRSRSNQNSSRNNGVTPSSATGRVRSHGLPESASANAFR